VFLNPVQQLTTPKLSKKNVARSRRSRRARRTRRAAGTQEKTKPKSHCHFEPYPPYILKKINLKLELESRKFLVRN